jgi:[acyl-carrier-protein] S-malonyltransferase
MEQTLKDGLRRIAVVFPGQGSQFVGMGRDLYESSAAARHVFQQAEEALGIDLRKLCFEGPEELLRETINAQPAILTVSVAFWEAIKERWEQVGGAVQPRFFAGHSLGEFSALVAAGALEFREAVRLVRERGRLMKEEGDRNPGGMAAVMGLDDAVLEEVCANVADKGIVRPANYNSPGQTVISGELSALTAAIELAVERGARKVVRLAISIASHSPVMRSASDQFSQALARVGLHDAHVPVVANISARAITSADDIRKELAEQITGSVRWSQSVKAMVEDGVQTIVEIGPGDALSGISRRISRDLQAFSVNSVEAIGQLPSRLQELELRRVRGLGTT